MDNMDNIRSLELQISALKKIYDGKIEAAREEIRKKLEKCDLFTEDDEGLLTLSSLEASCRTDPGHDCDEECIKLHYPSAVFDFCAPDPTGQIPEISIDLVVFYSDAPIHRDHRREPTRYQLRFTAMDSYALMAILSDVDQEWYLDEPPGTREAILAVTKYIVEVIVPLIEKM
jgi:hypothetical protein